MTCPKCGVVPQSPNPNLQRVCVRCGRMLTPSVTEITRAGHHAPLGGSLHAPRRIDLEREFTHVAARLVGVNPAALIAFAESRTLPGPLRDFWTRPWVTEGREETADFRNYVCWESQRIIALGDVRGLPHLGRALAHILLAWHELDAYQQARAH